MSGFYIKDGEDLHTAWWRCWHEDVLGAASYGQRTVIARMRRGKWVRIPSEWRGKVPHRPTIRKRLSKKPRKLRNQRNDILNPRLRAEARAPKIEEWE